MAKLIILSFAFGVLTKLADLFNEHGLKEPFNGASILAGLSWGVAGAGLLYFNPKLRIFYTALIFYWLLRLKLDYKNHAIGGLIVILSSLKICSIELSSHILEIIAILVAYEITRCLYHIIINKIVKFIFNLRLYIIPFYYSVYVNDYAVFTASIISILGVKIINKMIVFYKNRI